jgi:hypothetical protein
MATGKEMLDAVRSHLKVHPDSKELRLNVCDTSDLCELTANDLAPLVGDTQRVAQIFRDLAQQRLESLGDLLGVKLITDPDQCNLIPGAGIRRTEGIWADDPVIPPLTTPDSGSAHAHQP